MIDDFSHIWNGVQKRCLHYFVQPVYANQSRLNNNNSNKFHIYRTFHVAELQLKEF